MTSKDVAKKDEPDKAVAQQDEPGIKRLASGWHLVSNRTWEVSVGPDGLITLPRHLKPEEAADFVSAIQTAAALGVKIVADNLEMGRRDDRSLPPRLMVREGGVPSGAARLPYSASAGAPRAAIGRRVSRQAGPQPAGTQGLSQPRVPTPPRVRRPGQ